VKLGHRFIFFVVMVHALFVALSLLLLDEHKYLFIVAEILIFTSIGISIHLYRAFLKPLKLVSAAIESIKDQDFSTKFVGKGEDEMGRLINIYNRMIDQLRSERIKQREQHYFLQRLIAATPLGVIILDLDGNIDMINPAGKLMLGENDRQLVGRSIKSFKEQPGIELGTLEPGETKIINLNGIRTFKCHKSHFLDRGFHRHFIMIEELTKEILATQRNAYHKVIRMMSHEINNTVGAINSILDSSMNYSNQLTSDDRQDFENAMHVAVDRNTGLNRFMSNFAEVVRVPPPSKEPYDLHELLRSVHVLMSADCRKRDINWSWKLSSSPLIVSMDVQQMEQVLVNIVKNAIEAIDQGGSITVCTSSSEPKGLRIIDDGKGIAPDERPQLFTPFYSTKRDGQGIGLTLIREILINHNFTFNLETADDEGTEFWIEFNDSRFAI
jgi:nitrogen fixation/metabolism regulation signal transduction histidine kinase